MTDPNLSTHAFLIEWYFYPQKDEHKKSLKHYVMIPEKISAYRLRPSQYCHILPNPLYPTWVWLRFYLNFNLVMLKIIFKTQKMKQLKLIRPNQKRWMLLLKTISIEDTLKNLINLLIGKLSKRKTGIFWECFPTLILFLCNVFQNVWITLIL